jgi:hypothetical protein
MKKSLDADVLGHTTQDLIVPLLSWPPSRPRHRDGLRETRLLVVDGVLSGGSSLVGDPPTEPVSSAWSVALGPSEICSRVKATWRQRGPWPTKSLAILCGYWFRRRDSNSCQQPPLTRRSCSSFGVSVRILCRIGRRSSPRQSTPVSRSKPQSWRHFGNRESACVDRSKTTARAWLDVTVAALIHPRRRQCFGVRGRAFRVIALDSAGPAVRLTGRVRTGTLARCRGPTPGSS